MIKKIGHFFRPSNMLKLGAVSLGVTALAGLALFKGPESMITPAAYVLLAGATVSLAAFGIAAIGGLFRLGKKLFGKKDKATPADAAPAAVGVGGAAVAAGALALGGGTAVPPVLPPTPVVQAEESMAYPSLEEAGFQVMPTAEEAAAATGDPVAAPISAPVVGDVTLNSGDPVGDPNRMDQVGLIPTIAR